ncbi:helix-turn-helix domain-containing protein [Acinetobacter haemolyticus]|uniref:helix-turn-helix domain-containing protein n=1 Tax=Acinetobacter haemolyticus TaxID=29430 RepID=UPI003F55CE41
MLIPSILFDTYIDYAQEKNIDISKVFSSEHIQNSPVDITLYIRLIELIKTQLPQNDVGFDIGWRFTPQLFEPIGPAILSAKNLELGLNTLLKYWNVFCIGLKMHMERNKSTVDLNLQTNFPLEEEYENIILKSVVVCFYKLLIQMYPFEKKDIIIQFKDKLILDNPHDMVIQYESPNWKISFPIRLLSEKSFCANVLSFNRAITQCEAISNLYVNNDDLDNFIKQTLNEMAHKESISTKTIYRQLKRHGQSFQKLQQSMKYTKSLKLLNDKTLSIEQIATILGYQDPSNFTRAFKRWAHVSPSKYRKQHM